MPDTQDSGTERRENSGFNKKVESRGITLISAVDDLWLKDFSTWRKEQSAKALTAKDEGAARGQRRWDPWRDGRSIWMNSHWITCSTGP